MVLGVHLLDDVHADSVLVKDEGLAQCSHADLPVELLFAPCTESPESNPLGKSKSQSFFREARMIASAVRPDPLR